MKKTVSIEISPKTIIIILLFLAIAWLIIKLNEIILLVFVAFAIASMLSPIIDYLHRRRVPKLISISVIYILFVASIIGLILITYQPLITQFQEFTKQFPIIVTNAINSLIERFPFLQDRFDWEEILTNMQESFWASFEGENLSGSLLSGLKQAFNIVGSVFHILVSIVSTLILSIYFINMKEPSKKKFIKLLPIKHQKRIFNFFNGVEEQLGGWLRAQILLMILVGFLGWLGFEIIGMEFAIPMGITAGLLEAVPNLGPTITWAIAVIIGAGSDIPTWKFIFIFVWFILIQQFENYLIVPKLMQKVVGLNPALTIIAILGASKIFGLWGALLAVPTVAVLQISLRHYLKYREESNHKK